MATERSWQIINRKTGCEFCQSVKTRLRSGNLVCLPKGDCFDGNQIFAGASSGDGKSINFMTMNISNDTLAINKSPWRRQQLNPITICRPFSGLETGGDKIGCYILTAVLEYI